MIWVAGLGLGGFGMLCVRLGRSALYPPAVFSAVWSAALLLLASSGTLFYGVSERTILVFTLGAAAFAAGGVCADYALAPLSRRSERTSTRLTLPTGVLTGMLLILLIAGPFYVSRLTAVVHADGVSSFLYGVRVRAVAGDDGGLNGALGVLANIVPLSIIFTLIAFAGARPRLLDRSLCLALFVTSLGYQLSTGGRAGATTLVFSTLAVVFLVAGRIRLLPLLASAAVFVAMFSVIAVALGKGNTRRDGTLRENLPSLVEGFEWYALGGLVAFGRIVDSPHAVPSTGGIARTVDEMANKFGAEIEIPSLYAQYSTIGDEKDTNVYTMYFSYYPDFGLGGSLALVSIVGAALVFAFRFAQSGSPTAIVLYAILFSSILFSVFNEGFLTNVNLLGKALVATWLAFIVWAREAPQVDAVSPR